MFIFAPPVKWEFHVISTCPWSYLYGLGKRVPATFKIGWLLHYCASHSIISTTKWAVCGLWTWLHSTTKKLLLQWIRSDTASSAQLYMKVFVEWVPKQNQCIYIFNLQIPEFMGTIIYKSLPRGISEFIRPAILASFPESSTPEWQPLKLWRRFQ